MLIFEVLKTINIGNVLLKFYVKPLKKKQQNVNFRNKYDQKNVLLKYLNIFPYIPFDFIFHQHSLRFY